MSADFGHGLVRFVPPELRSWGQTFLENCDDADDAETAGSGFAVTLASRNEPSESGNGLGTLWLPEAVDQ